MYKMFLVDDEPDVLSLIISTVSWEKHGFSIPTGFSDGEAVIQAIEQGQRPDVIITDIYMPKINGLELTSYVAENLPDTIVAIFSGYDEFSYAQKALSLHVHDYLLKPVTPLRLAELLDSLREKLDEKQLDNLYYKEELLRNDFLNRLSSSSMDPAVIDDYLKQFQLDWKGSCLVVFLLDIDRTLPDLESDSEEDARELQLMRYGLHNICCELLETNPAVIPFFTKSNLTGLIFSDISEKTLKRESPKTVQTIIDVVEKSLERTISAGMGSIIKDDISLIHQSYLHAIQALELRFYTSGGEINYFSSPISSESISFHYTPYEQEFSVLLENFDESGLSDCLNRFFSELSSKKVGTNQCIKYCHRLILQLLHFSAEYLDEKEMQMLEVAWKNHHLEDATTLFQLQTIIQRFYEQVNALLSLIRDDASAAQVSRAINYIKQNYANPKLSLQMITDYLSVSTSYFSSAFKTRTNQTFIEYLTGVRMEKAKHMLRHTALKSYEVAENAGYSDPHYFSVAFKRFTGKTPKEYRENAQKDIS